MQGVKKENYTQEKIIHLLRKEFNIKEEKKEEGMLKYNASTGTFYREA